ncbi:MAG: hypothetical protein WAS36_03280 [Candidatus Saccharimonadales bacterium]
MWNNFSVSIEKRKFIYFSGLLLVALLFFGSARVFAAFPALDYQGGWWSPNHNYISNNVYMQHVVSRDGYTDIYSSKLEIYSRDPEITVEIFGADICTNQPSYTTDEFFTSSSSARANMSATYSVGPATDLVSPTPKIGVETRGGTPGTVTTSGKYKGSSCTSANARRVVTARSNVYDRTLGRYVYNFVASIGSQSGVVNGFRIRAMGTTNPYDGMFISPESANGSGGLAAAKAFGIEAGYPRQDNNNPGASSTYATFSYPFVANCDLAAPGASAITLYDDDNGNSSVQSSTKFNVRILRTDVSPVQVIAFTPTFPSGGSATGADANGYRTITTPDTSYSYLNFNMVASGTYRFDVRNLYQDNTLQISLPGIASPAERNCPQPATLDGVKMDSNFGATIYGGNITGAFSGMNTTVAGKSDAENPFLFNGSKSIPVSDFRGKAYSVRLASAVPAGWQLRGYKICGSNEGTCTNAYLADGNNILTPSKDASGRFYFNKTFLPGVAYHMRWVFMPTVAINCVQPPLFSPENPDTFTTFNLTAGVEFGTYIPVNPRIRLTALNEAKTITYPTATRPDQNLLAGASSTTFTGLRLTDGMKYVFRWTYQDSLQTVTCERTKAFGFQPYVEIFGGDFLAGGGSRTGGSLAGVQSWNHNNDPPAGLGSDYGGAGTTHAVLASGDIQYFASGRDTWLGGWFPENLSFSNQGAAVNKSNGLYGGSFTAVPLKTSYYEQANDQDGIIEHDGENVVNVGALSSGIHRYTGDISLYGTVGLGRTVTVITNGDVLISTAGGANLGYAAYAAISEIPRLNVYTQVGDIMVAAGVNEIHGVFAAGGNFYSCTVESPLNPIDYSELGVSANNTACFTQLKIYGSVHAEELILARTRDTHRKPGAIPAEVIIYSPELWLGQSGSSSPAAVTMNSYIGLPPIL